jgi:YcxB-like protein
MPLDPEIARMRSMEFHFLPREEDWQNARSLSSTSAWGMFQFLLSFTTLFLLGGFLITTGSSVTGWLCVGLSIATALASYEVPRILQRRVFRASPFTKGEWSITINDDGITVKFPMVKSESEWRAFTRYRETKAGFVLCVSTDHIGPWIPKREMSGEQIEELRQILNTRLSRS